MPFGDTGLQSDPASAVLACRFTGRFTAAAGFVIPWRVATPFTMIINESTMLLSSLAWAESSSDAEADSSALAAFDWVDLSIWPMASPICAMPLDCYTLAPDTSPMSRPSSRAPSTI